MPTNRKRRTRNRTGAANGRQLEHLIFGWCLAFNPSDYGHSDHKFPFIDGEHRRRCWEENQEYIMSFAGKGRIPGVFGGEPLKKGRKPQAAKDYEKHKGDKNGRKPRS